MKIYAKKGHLLYCKELNIKCTCTTDTEHEWVNIPIETEEEIKEVEEDAEQ